MRITAQPLTRDTVHANLSIISPEHTTDRTRVGNQGTSTKTPDIAPCTNFYDQAPSGQPGRAVMSSSRNTPRAIITQDDGKETLEVGFLERHPFSTQAFIPMGGSDEPSYIVIVADNQTDGSPDLDSIKAYRVKGTQGVCYAAGVWHAPMATIHKVGRLFVGSGRHQLTLSSHSISESFST